MREEFGEDNLDVSMLPAVCGIWLACNDLFVANEHLNSTDNNKQERAKDKK